MTDAEKKAAVERVDKAVATLIEHFDSVQIFCTHHVGETRGGSIGYARGQGNWYARYGQVREWVAQQEGEARVSGSVGGDENEVI